MSRLVRCCLLLTVGSCVGDDDPGRPAATAPSHSLAQGSPFRIETGATARFFTLGIPTEVSVSARLLDSVGNDLSGYKVTWVVDSGGGRISRVPVQDTTRIGGSITADWLLGDTARRQVAHVEAGGLVSQSHLVFGAVGKLAIVSGNNQRGRPGQALPSPVVVKAFTTRDVPLGPGFPVIFRPLDRFGIAKASDTVLTDASGLATQPVPWTLEPGGGRNAMTVLGETGGPSVVTATAEAVAPKPERIIIGAGNNQRGSAGTFLSVRPVVTVLDSAGLPMPNQPIEAAIFGPGGSTRSFAAHRTDDHGQARIAAWRLGYGPGPNRLRVSTPGLPPTPVTFDAVVDSLPSRAFTITTQFRGVFPIWLALPLGRAATGWEQVVVGDLPDWITPLPADPSGCHPAVDRPIDDLLVIIEVVRLDGPGNQLGDVKICRTRPNGLPLVSRIRLDHDDLDRVDDQVGIERALRHFLGHALGLGTGWAGRADLADPAGLRYLGQSTVQAANWSRWVPDDPVLLPWDVVPLGDVIHWADAVGSDIMTATLTRQSEISTLSAAALRELGYLVADSGALDLVRPGSAVRTRWRVDGGPPARGSRP